MFDPSDENEPDRLLREGLRRLPVPETSADFDARIHAALELPEEPWWRTLWANSRPVLSAAACSLLLMLLLLHWMGDSPVTTPAHPATTGQNTLAWDPGMERLDLSHASFRSLSALRPLP